MISSCRLLLASRTAVRRVVRSAPIARTFSISNNDDKDSNSKNLILDGIQFSPPDKLTADMAEGIADATHFYIQYGLSHRRLQNLASDKEIPVVSKWQKMMEIFLTTQVHVIAGMGYGASEQGLTQYAQDLAKCMSEADETTSAVLREVRRDTWRTLVATCFELDVSEIPTLSIVDARNLMHKVSSKMIEPDTLLEIQTKASKVSDSDAEVEVAMKHDILQQIIVNRVYLGGNPSITQEAGFGTGPQAYAKLQCAMSDHESDPLIAQYATAAMVRIWQAAGLDLSSMQGGGAAA